MYTTIRGLAAVATLSLLCSIAVAGSGNPQARAVKPRADVHLRAAPPSQADKITRKINPPAFETSDVDGPKLEVSSIKAQSHQYNGNDYVDFLINVSNHGDASSVVGEYELWFKCDSFAPKGRDCALIELGHLPQPFAIAPSMSFSTKVAPSMPWAAGMYRIAAWIRKAGTGPGPLGLQQHMSVMFMVGGGVMPTAPRAYEFDPMPLPPGKSEGGFSQPGNAAVAGPQPESPSAPSGGFANPQLLQ